MKIITLNTWGGRGGKEKLLSFFQKYGPSTDVFCLQEIWSAPYDHLEGASAGGTQINNSDIMTSGMQEISNILPDHVTFFHPHHGDHYGLLMLVKKNLNVREEGEEFVYKYKGFVPEGDVGLHARNIQYVTLETAARPITIINFHGLWTGQGKADTEDRLEQSKKIIRFLQTRKNEYVLCGDFNLLPDTKSIQMIEESGLRNLIKEYQVTSTRTSYYTKPDKFADYIFTTPGLIVKSFQVLPEEVSDHAALEVTLDLGI
ncbi:endonuclease/exonuclease/phosphatase family protein [Candidatus Uhrbacteria bacterium]|nr:endonuclease/exonuclease/phosphatase family protein [Candidatus Uhrbacteria bacterium]